MVERHVGHADSRLTMNIYAHVVPVLQQEAATLAGAYLTGDGYHVAAIDTRGRRGDGVSRVPSPDRDAAGPPRKDSLWPR